MEGEFKADWINLASAKFGARVTYATDEFFADKSRLIQDSDPVYVDGKYDENGKWMDGWETRRKREPGHDYCIVKLAFPGEIRGLLIDTTFFNGNFPPYASVDACHSSNGDPEASANWMEIQPKSPLKGNSSHRYRCKSDRVFTYVRLNIYPDGGVARLRVFGRVRRLWNLREPDQVYDLLALENGGRPLAWNDAHFGNPVNMLGQGRGVNMGDGWETHRRRDPGNDWCVLALGHPGFIERIIVDTAHFKGNYPDRCSIQAALSTCNSHTDVVKASADWAHLLPEMKLSADAIHEFKEDVVRLGPISHIRFNIYPDGGVSRLRLLGRIYMS